MKLGRIACLWVESYVVRKVKAAHRNAACKKYPCLSLAGLIPDYGSIIGSYANLDRPRVPQFSVAIVSVEWKVPHLLTV